MSVKDQIPRDVHLSSISSWNRTEQGPGVASQLVSVGEAENVDETEVSTELDDAKLAVTGTLQPPPGRLNLSENVMMMRGVREG